MDELRYYDSHFHIQEMIKKHSEKPYYPDPNTWKISGGIDIATSVHDYETRYDLLAKYSSLHLSIGLYPSFAKDNYIKDLDSLSKKLDSIQTTKPAIALGEIGIDFYWDYGSEKRQCDLLLQQIKIANFWKVPVIIHNRNADRAILKVFHQITPEYGAILHCFSSDKNFLFEILKIPKLYVSFAGNLTFKKAITIQESALNTPLNRLLFETDSPYLSPVPKRGKLNYPDHVIHTYVFFSHLANIDIAELVKQVEINLCTLFPIFSNHR